MSRHQITRGNTTVPELQNRCAGESSQAGSIPVRLRYQRFWVRRARVVRQRARFTGLKNLCRVPGTQD
jgi:ribosomal protein L19E